MRPTQKRSEPSRRLGVGGYREWESTTCCSCNVSCCTTEYTGGIPSSPGPHSKTPGGMHSHRPQFPARVSQGGLCCAAFTLLLASSPPPPSSPARGRLSRQVGSPPTMGPSMPSDIDPQSGFRLPLPTREDLDEAGKAHYDRATAPGAS